MHYYKFNIADYRKDTGHLSTIEHGIYRQLIDWYYLDEKPIPTETHVVFRRLRLGSDIEFESLQNVLSDFFVEEKTGYVHKRIEVEIKDYHGQAEKNKNNGKLGGRPKKTQSVISGFPNESQINPNQEPITINHKPKEKTQRGSRLANDFQFPLEWETFCKQTRPDLNPEKTFDQFKDYWVSSLKGTKLDWFATWRNWVRSTNAPKTNPADIARVTVPPSNLPDPALEKIKADAMRAAPIPLDVLAKMAELRKAKQ
jgi:uncharacterized protein YdaU (DUF1376 family)